MVILYDKRVYININKDNNDDDNSRSNFQGCKAQALAAFVIDVILQYARIRDVCIVDGGYQSCLRCGYPALRNNASSNPRANRLQLQIQGNNDDNDNGDVNNNNHSHNVNLSTSVRTNIKDTIRSIEIKTNTSKNNSSVVIVEPDRKTSRSNSSHCKDSITIKDSFKKVIELETLSHPNNISNIFHKSPDSRFCFTIKLSHDYTSEKEDDNVDDNELQSPSSIMQVSITPALDQEIHMNNVDNKDHRDHTPDLDLTGLNKFSTDYPSSNNANDNENTNTNKNNKFNDPTDRDIDNETAMPRTKTG